MNESKQSLSIPVAIIVAGALIAFGIYWTGRGNTTSVNEQNTAQTGIIKPITAEDHVLGDRKAPISIIVYSDIECPFCKQFHTTLHDLMKEYGVSGKISWAFRHFPVHENSVKEAEALECAAELGGNESFWQFADKMFETTKSNNGLDLLTIPTLATQIGLDGKTFKTCLDSGKYKTKVEKDLQNIVNAGAQGTPYSAIFVNNELVHEVKEGALPYDQMKSRIDTIISEL